MKLRTSWCAALVACLALATFSATSAASPANATKNREYQMASECRSSGQCHVH